MSEFRRRLCEAKWVTRLGEKSNVKSSFCWLLVFIKIDIKYWDSIQIENDSKIEHPLSLKQEYFRITLPFCHITCKEEGASQKPFNLHYKDILNFVESIV